MEKPLHIPVMVDEVISFLNLKEGGYYLDGTLGLGGHAIALLKEKEGRLNLLGMDQDSESLLIAENRIKEAGFENNIILVNDRFSNFAMVLKKIGWKGLDGAILDLGISSFQLEDPRKGLSFLKDFPLDMRINSALVGFSAKDIVNTFDVKRLQYIIKVYGEDPFAARIARAIVSYRKERPIETTKELAEIVENAYPEKFRRTAKNHPATRTFQALRIYVNKELDELKKFLNQIPYFLNPGGRVVVISFHSLEDRFVKKAFREFEKGNVRLEKRGLKFSIITHKPLVPSKEEIKMNPRSRSAKMRVGEVERI